MDNLVEQPRSSQEFSSQQKRNFKAIEALSKNNQGFLKKIDSDGLPFLIFQDEKNRYPDPKNPNNLIDGKEDYKKHFSIITKDGVFNGWSVDEHLSFIKTRDGLSFSIAPDIKTGEIIAFSCGSGTIERRLILESKMPNIEDWVVFSENKPEINIGVKNEGLNQVIEENNESEADKIITEAKRQAEVIIKKAEDQAKKIIEDAIRQSALISEQPSIEEKKINKELSVSVDEIPETKPEVVEEKDYGLKKETLVDRIKKLEQLSGHSITDYDNGGFVDNRIPGSEVLNYEINKKEINYAINRQNKLVKENGRENFNNRVNLLQTLCFIQTYKHLNRALSLQKIYNPENFHDIFEGGGSLKSFGPFFKGEFKNQIKNEQKIDPQVQKVLKMYTEYIDKDQDYLTQIESIPTFDGTEIFSIIKNYKGRSSEDELSIARKIISSNLDSLSKMAEDQKLKGHSVEVLIDLLLQNDDVLSFVPKTGTEMVKSLVLKQAYTDLAFLEAEKINPSSDLKTVFEKQKNIIEIIISLDSEFLNSNSNIDVNGPFLLKKFDKIRSINP